MRISGLNHRAEIFGNNNLLTGLTMNMRGWVLVIEMDKSRIQFKSVDKLSHNLIDGLSGKFLQLNMKLLLENDALPDEILRLKTSILWSCFIILLVVFAGKMIFLTIKF